MKVLVIAAHPDDEVLGCGGTIARLARAGDEVHVTILGEGLTSRYEHRGAADPEDLGSLQDQAREASTRMGAQEVALHQLPDNRFDTEALLDIVKICERTIDQLSPEVVYTHHGGDLNVDHQVVHRAVLTATRPFAGQPVREVYAWEVPSSTEWSFQRLAGAFRPNVFVDISDTLEVKMDAMRAYESEIREFPHPRSPEALEAIAKRWGAVAGFRAAEAFELVRSLRR